MNADLRTVIFGWTTILMLVGTAAAQETPPEQKPPTNQDAAATLGVQLLKSSPGTELQYDNSLSVLLAKNLISSNDLGVDLAEIQPALRAQLNLAEGVGMVVTSVPDDSPGEKAGLKPHDVLVNIGTASVGNLEQVAAGLQKAPGESADKTAMLGVIRQGKSLTIKATPKSPWVAELAITDAPVTAWTRVNVNHEPRYRIGVVLSEADETLRAQVGLAAGEGLIVSEVFPDTPAAKAGIQPHDVLVILDGKRLSTVDAANAQIQEIKEREVELKLLRGGKEIALKIAPQKEAAETTSVSVDQFRRALTIWSAHGCPAAQAQSRQCASCHSDPFPQWKMPQRIHDYHMLRQWITQQPAAAGSPQEQVNQLKEQLAKMQETLSTLEANLQAGAAKEETQPKPEEKK